MLFSTAPNDIKYEIMMTQIQNFTLRGHRIHVFEKLDYGTEHCNCSSCQLYKRKKYNWGMGCINDWNNFLYEDYFHLIISTFRFANIHYIRKDYRVNKRKTDKANVLQREIAEGIV